LASITVGLEERSYTIQFGHDILAVFGGVCRDLKLGSTVALITNPTVGALYGRQVEASLAASGFSVHVVEIPDGEEFKNIVTLTGIYTRLIQSGLDRGACIVALGGGVVGDIAGFAAATYLRGIPFVQVPTTLLAQVDSSVGGKTGINHELGKNLIGAFYQPAHVLVDVATLETLPRREYLGGLAEVVKYGVVLDGGFFDFIASHVAELLSKDTQTLLQVTQRCCELKASIVEQDEKESGLRAVLNYGHTFGHAVETLTGYTRFSHGEAVAIGMVQAAKVSERMGYSAKAVTERIVGLLRQLDLPTDLPPFGMDEYRDALLRDKKVRAKGLNFVCNKGIGEFVIERMNDIDYLINTVGIGA
jgi:3-dehydroquinate synthase